MKISDYAKIEELKRMLVGQLVRLGMIEETEVINEDDLDMMLSLMAQLNKELMTKDTVDERMDMLVGYIIGLWARLIIDYGAKMEDM